APRTPRASAVSACHWSGLRLTQSSIAASHTEIASTSVPEQVQLILPPRFPRRRRRAGDITLQQPFTLSPQLLGALCASVRQLVADLTQHLSTVQVLPDERCQILEGRFKIFPVHRSTAPAVEVISGYASGRSRQTDKPAY